MSVETVLRIIGFSHLLQPPLTALLARRLGLRVAFESLPKIAFGVAQNMAVAAVALPTSLGLFIAWRAHEVVEHGSAFAVAVATSLFWTFRLERQLRSIGPLLRDEDRFFHPLLTAIFVVQGPLLAALLVATSVA
ncbi:MAG TPA: hypothetical protein VH062_24940 [Polyangiaceae bacterium]|jgi:hypothetical protein|nr:hypothetical protein [Polyangiaceae bacterium]